MEKEREGEGVKCEENQERGGLSSQPVQSPPAMASPK